MTLLANSLLDEHKRLTHPSLPRDVARNTGEQIDKLLSDPAIQPDEIRAGLALLRAKPNLGPGILPTLVNQVRQEAAHPELARGQRRGSHRPYRNPEDQSAYDTGFTDDE